MRKRNHTVTIRMNKEEYDLFQSKVKESGRTQQEVVIKAIADLKIASAEEIEELKRLNQMFADAIFKSAIAFITTSCCVLPDSFTLF